MAAILIVLGGMGLAAEPPTTDQQLAGEVRRLVRQLDDDRPEVRQAAEQQLVELGPAALPLLPQTTAQLSPEVRRRLAEVTSRLQEVQATRAIQGTRVQLRGRLTLCDILDAIQRQTGNRFVVGAGVNQSEPWDVDFQDVLFWEGVDRTLDRAGATIDLYGGEAHALSVVPVLDDGGGRAGRAAYAGPFRVEATQITLARDLRRQGHATMRLRVEVLWEPQLDPIALSLPLAGISAEDDLGHALAVSDARAVLDTAVSPLMPGVALEFPFQAPDRTARRIVELKGALTTLLPGRREEFAFGNLAEAAGKKLQHAGVTVLFEQLRKNEDVYEARIQLQFDAPGRAFESHRGWFYQNDAFVVDPQGTRMRHEQLEQTGRTANSVRLTYRFVLPEPPGQYTFVYRTPVMILKREIPFTLREIKLP